MDDLPIEASVNMGFPSAMFHYRNVHITTPLSCARVNPPWLSRGDAHGEEVRGGGENAFRATAGNFVPHRGQVMSLQ